MKRARARRSFAFVVGRNLAIQRYRLDADERRRLRVGLVSHGPLSSNHAVRHAFGAPPLPPNPACRRHAFKIGSAWLLALAVLFAAGAGAVGLVLGGPLLVACASATALYFCVPAYVMSRCTRAIPRRKEWLATTTRS